MRLTDADTLLDAISVHLERIEQEFEDAPTIDPVRHGKWQLEGYTARAGKVYRCTECGCISRHNGNYKYCPNCGAKMYG